MRERRISAFVAEGAAASGSSTSMHTPFSHTTLIPSTTFVSAESPAMDMSNAARNGIMRFMPAIVPKTVHLFEQFLSFLYGGDVLLV
jgi:hypothetical protein